MNAPSPREVIELRVHGVGGGAAEGLLGVASTDDLVRVGGSGQSSFEGRRADRHVEGFVWGRLTSKALLQPLWLILLPFTLVNVAGWMHPPEEEQRGWREDPPRHPRVALRAFRLLLFFVGLAFTASYVLWTANIVINRALDFEVYLGMRGADAKLWMAGGVIIFALVVVLLLARWVQSGFEGFDGPTDCGPHGEVRLEARTDRGAGLVRDTFVRARSMPLQAQSFWARAPEAKLLLTLHIAIAIAAVFWAVLWSGARLGNQYLRLGLVASAASEATLWGLAALALVLLLGWRQRWGAWRFRVLGPVTAAVTGVGLGTGFLYGLTLILLPQPGPEVGLPRAPRIDALGIAFGVAAFAWVVGLIAYGGWLLWKAFHPSPPLDEPGPGYVPPSTAGPGEEPDGATPLMRGKIRLARATSEAGRNGDLLLSFVQIVFLAAALVQLRTGRFSDVAGLASTGRLVATGATGLALIFLWRRARKPEDRRTIGILWDVLTFWPRRYHPLAVRPYSERAVPQLQHRLCHHLSRGCRVVVSAHSQGTVIAYAALVQLPDEAKRELALVTYGSPLRQLHEMAFPAYFSRPDFEALRTSLFDDRAPKRHPAGWRSFYRLTDYIGKQVFPDDPLEEPIPDPAQAPALSGQPLDVTVGGYPDPPRTIWADLYRHSFYNSEERLQAWVAEVRCRMGEPHLDCTDYLPEV